LLFLQVLINLSNGSVDFKCLFLNMLVGKTIMSLFSAHGLSLMLMPSFDAVVIIDKGSIRMNRYSRNPEHVVQFLWLLIKLTPISNRMVFSSSGFMALQGNLGNVQRFTLHGVPLSECLFPRSQYVDCSKMLVAFSPSNIWLGCELTTVIFVFVLLLFFPF
jgi:hypothetical protein